MSLESIINKKIDTLETVPAKFIDLVDKQNETLFKELLKLLGTLEKDGDTILLTDKNIAKITAINDLLQQTLFEGDYIIGLKEFVNSFDAQAGLINEIFDEQFDFTEKPLYKSVLKQSQKSTLELLDGDGIGQSVFKPLQDKLITSIYSQSSYAEMVIVMKDYILGTEGIDPKLTSYVTRYARDAFSVFDRTYTQIIAKDVDAEYYEYAGGTLKDSREFCLARHGNVYTADEIASWASEDWQGKNQATDESTIFNYLGGYNCIHSLVVRDKNFINIDEVNKYN